MGTRIVAVGFALLGIAYAFSPRAHNVERVAVAATVASVATVTAEPAPMPTRVGDSLMRGDVVVRMSTPREVVLRVTNTGRKLAELRFPDGQTHEFVVRDAAEREVWRWSAGRMFTQALRTRPIDGGETVEFRESWPGALPGGTYTVVAQLRSQNHPLEVRRAIALP
jgi:hypothetical protein